MANALIEIKDVFKSYSPGYPVLHGVSVSIPEKAFVTIIGPSGCGKTTLLRLMNAMEQFDSGTINIRGMNIENWDKIQLRRGIGYVIQQGALFPHMNIKENMEFVLKISGEQKEIMEQRVTTLAGTMGFDDRQLAAYPQELSGGQQQRVGVARALAAEPDIVLMDEPFGALDNITRRNLQKELKGMHAKLGVTFIMVTHDLQEAFSLGTHVAIMNNGRIEQFDSPENIRNNPANDWVKEFISY